MQLDILTIQGVGVDTLIIEGGRSVAICPQMPLKIVVDAVIIALDVNAPEDVGVFSSQAKLARTVAVLMHLGMRVDAAITTHATVYFFYIL